MKRIILVLVAVTALTSCFRDKYEVSGGKGGKEVEIQIYGVSDAQTKNLGTPEENTVRHLDLLVFKNDRFLYWRSAYKVDGNYRATLEVDSGIDVYFLANCRDQLFHVFPTKDAEQSYIGYSWEGLMEVLVDTQPQRLLQNGPAVPLPMWADLKDQTVDEMSVNHWPIITLLRSVASVDVMVRDTVTAFQLTDLYVYFAPDKGYLGNRDQNYSLSGYVYFPESPYDMETKERLHSDLYDYGTMSIANKIYLYDNDYDQNNTPTAGKRSTRVVVGGFFRGSKYYYPIDFEDDVNRRLIPITRNWKYVFMINSVSGKGYSDPDYASTEPPVNLNYSVMEWKENIFGDFAVSWPYYVWLENKLAILHRDAGNYVYIGLNSNVPESDVKLSFETFHNGAQREVTESESGCEGNGIKNNRFRIEKITEPNTQTLKALKITAVENYYPDAVEPNEDKISITAGQITFVINITQLDKSNSDWTDGGNEDVNLK